MTTEPGPVPYPEERPTVTVEEAAQWLGIGRSAAYVAAQRGEIPAIRLGRLVRIPTAALRVLLALDPPPDADTDCTPEPPPPGPRTAGDSRVVPIKPRRGA